MKKYAFLWHCLFWLAIPFMLTFITWAYQFTIFLPAGKNFAKNYFTLFTGSMVLNVVIVAIGAPVFYLTSALLPFPKKFKRALALVLLLLVWPALLVVILSFFSFAVYWSFRYFLLTAYVTVIPFMALGAFAVVQKRLVQLENRNIKTELELLRAQLHPHFLFNTINNIDSLIQKDQETASRYLNELSDMLRFMLYETRSESIPLSKELDYIQKYINLQRMRSVNPGFIHFYIHGKVHTQTIAPMLFIPFIENAFKHAANKTNNHAIKLGFDISANEILFTCSNSVIEQKSATTNGLGNQLIIQRLDLLYKNRYELKTDANNGKYRVQLKILFHAH